MSEGIAQLLASPASSLEYRKSEKLTHSSKTQDLSSSSHLSASSYVICYMVLSMVLLILDRRNSCKKSLFHFVWNWDSCCSNPIYPIILLVPLMTDFKTIHKYMNIHKCYISTLYTYLFLKNLTASQVKES